MIDPLLLCQQGLAQSHRGELLALQTLAAARDGLRRKQDAPGLALTAAALLITGQSMSNYRRFREHAEALTGGMARCNSSIEPRICWPRRVCCARCFS